MHWSVVPFGKYQGKTFPEIIVRDPDCFFGHCRNFTASLQKRRRSSHVKLGPSNLHDEVEGAWQSNMNLTGIASLMASSLSTLTALLPDGVLDYHTSICGGRFAANMTSERALSCFGISGDAILASTND